MVQSVELGYKEASRAIFDASGRCIRAVGTTVDISERRRAEAVLRDAEWHEATAQAAMLALGNDYAPLSDMRATSNYRLEAAKNTLYRFWLETRPNNPLPRSALDVRAVAAACAPVGASA